MKITKNITVAANPADVWRVIAEEYDQVDRWASAVERSMAVAGGSAPGGAPVAGRTCETSLGPFKERIVEYDETNHRLAYEASGEKMPFFVKNMTARWRLSQVKPGTTDVAMTLDVRLLPVFNVLMALPMKIQLGKVVQESIEECKHFVETGEPHPRKKALLAAG